jgi:hypothetical protein
MKGDKVTVRAFLGPAFDVGHVVIETEVQCLGCLRKWVAMRDCTPCGCDAKLKSIAEHVRFIATIKPQRRRPPVNYAHGCSRAHDPGLRCKHGRCCFDCIDSGCLKQPGP